MEIRGAVLAGRNQEFRLETLTLDAPQADEVLVRIVACGICHTDLAVRDGTIPFPPAPMVLGHEGSGIVEAVGSEVTSLAPGDHVVLSYASCGICPDCQDDRPFHCEAFFALNVSGRRPDGTFTHHHGDEGMHACFFGQSSFGTHTIAKANNAVKVTEDVPIEILGPLGCGVQTGAGAVLNHIKPAPGTSMVVFGMGAVGLSAVMAAKVAGCSKIVAVDLHESRLELARSLGATDVVNGREGDSVTKVKEIVGSAGAQFVIEATGVPAAVAQALQVCVRRGEVVLLGSGPMTAPVTVPLSALVAGGKIRGCTEGDSIPGVFIPKLIDLYKQGRFPFDRLVSFYPFKEINRAVADSKSGKAIKPIVVMSGAE